jgi:hypothetical protein
MHFNPNHDPKNGRFTFRKGEALKNINPAYAIKNIKRARELNSKEYKKFNDSVIPKGTKTQTLAFDKNRLDNADMFYATYHPIDSKSFRYSLSGKMMRTLYDDDGNEIGTGMMSRNINLPTTLKKDIKVASEESSATAFSEIFKNNKDFRDFVLNDDRLSRYIDHAKIENSKEYNEAKNILNKIKKDPDNISDKDLKTIYKLFDFVIPYEGGVGKNADPKIGQDIVTQRTKFFKELKNNGYGACLDAHDALYQKGMSATSPVIIFDMEKVVKNEAERITNSDRMVTGYLATIGKKFLGL